MGLFQAASKNLTTGDLSEPFSETVGIETGYNSTPVSA